MSARMTLTVSTGGFGRAASRVHRQLGQVVNATAHEVEARANAAVQEGPKTGQVYGAHQASAPGEAPATDTGNLANSIQAQMTGPLAAEVSVGAEYAAALEFGTADGKIAPRPFLEPALDAARPGFEAAVKSVLQRGGQ